MSIHVLQYSIWDMIDRVVHPSLINATPLRLMREGVTFTIVDHTPGSLEAQFFPAAGEFVFNYRAQSSGFVTTSQKLRVIYKP